MEEHHHSFRAMNTDVDVFVLAERRPSDAFLSVELLFEQQEQRFSRFRETSLLSRFNRGEAIADLWFAAAIRLSLDMYDETGGLFNPAILPSLRAAGYEVTFEKVAGGDPLAGATPPFPEMLRTTGDRCELLGGAIDLGGIVKGWTVDLAAEHLAQSFEHLLVNAGGDMRAVGSDSGGSGWLVEIDTPSGASLWSGRISAALATSTTRKRRWKTSTGESAHHLIDPRSGLPADSGWIQTSVRAETCVRAECWAKAAIVGGDEAISSAAAHGLDIVACAADGTVRFIGNWQE